MARDLNPEEAKAELELSEADELKAIEEAEKRGEAELEDEVRPEHNPKDMEVDGSKTVKLEEDEEKKPEDKKAPKKAEDKKAPKKPEEKPEEKKPEEQKMVPHEAMHAEREKAKQLKAQLDKIQKDTSEREKRLNERLLQIQEAMSPKKEKSEEQQEAMPDPAKDPQGAWRWLAEEQRKTREYLNQQHTQTTEQQKQAEAEQAVWDEYRDKSMEYAQENEDFGTAYQYLLYSREQELKAMGYPPKKIEEIIQMDEFSLALQARETGTNPAEIIVNWSKARGYSPDLFKKQKQPEQKQPEQQQSESGADKLRRLKSAKEESETLSGGGSAPDANTISLEAIDRMSPKEFNDLIKRLTKNDPNGADKLFEKLEAGS